MYRFLSCLLAAAALAPVAAGCGGDAVEPASAVESSFVEASPSAHPNAGWSAPAAVPGAAPPARLSEEFRSGAALRGWGYFEGDYGRNRFRVRDGRLDVVPPKSAWVDAH